MEQYSKYTDRNGNKIRQGHVVMYKNLYYEVDINMFNGKFVIDNDYGQLNLKHCHKDVEVSGDMDNDSHLLPDDHFIQE